MNSRSQFCDFRIATGRAELTHAPLGIRTAVF
jgi:hypothetical protein